MMVENLNFVNNVLSLDFLVVDLFVFALNDGKYFCGIILAAAELNGLYAPGYSAPTSSSAKL